MRKVLFCTVVLGGLLGLSSFPETSAILAASPGYEPRVAGFARFSVPRETLDEETIEPDLPGVGRLLLGELNCIACHAAGDWAPLISAKPAPVLNDVGERVQLSWIEQSLTDVHATKLGTTMPAVLARFSPQERAEVINSLVQLLATTGTATVTAPDSGLRARGEELFTQVGCVACHQPLNSSKLWSTTIVFPQLSAKYTTDSLDAFLRDPLHSRAGGRMPQFDLDDETRRHLVSYLLGDIEVPPNTRFAAYEGTWSEVPDFGTLQPIATGECAGLDLNQARRTNNFGMRFETHIHLPSDGNYWFQLGSDDGSILSIDGERVIVNDGIHPHTNVELRKQLAAGWHDVTVDYIQGGGEWTLRLEIEGPGLSRRNISGLAHLTRDDAALVTVPKSGIELKPELAAAGKKWFGAVGCANCHQLQMQGQRIEASLSAKPLAECRLDRGCLADAPSPASALYQLSDLQRQAIRAALSQRPADIANGPAERIHQTLLAQNCYACHARGENGGVEENRNAYFKSTTPEMGDEGRIPPILKGVGDKLRPDWLRHLLEHGASERGGYMLTRMPKFGLRNVEHLIEDFAAADITEDIVAAAVTPPEYDEPIARVRGHGRLLVGAKALSCIKCHDFGEYPSTGIRAINLHAMTRRLRSDWFQRYLVNPTAYRPGTRMPSSWPYGEAVYKDLYDGNPPRQIGAIWKYLEEPGNSGLPHGLVRGPIELKPVDGVPVIYRNFISDAGSRAIGIGYPEEVNLAFDANDLRLALLWKGGFIDASRHWNDRGVGFQGPLGDQIQPLVHGSAFAILASPSADWPGQPARDLGYRFRGYRLDDKQRPIFQYRVEGLAIEDHLVPQSAGSLARTITASGTPAQSGLYLRAARGQSIQERSPAVFVIDNALSISAQGAAAGGAVIRDSQGQQELLFPVNVRGGSWKLVLDYKW